MSPRNDTADLLGSCRATDLTIREYSALAFAAALLQGPQAPLYASLPDGPKMLATFSVALAEEWLAALTAVRT